MSLATRTDLTESRGLHEVEERQWAETLKSHETWFGLPVEGAHALANRPERLPSKTMTVSLLRPKDDEVESLGCRVPDLKS